MDGNTIAIVGVVVGLLGVLASVIMPLVVRRRARIFFEAKEFTLIGDPGPRDHGHDISLTVSGKPVLSPTYLLTAVIQNSGGVDIGADVFTAPVELRFAAAVQMLTASASAPAGVNPVIEVGDNGARLSWTLLKPGEAVKVAALVATQIDPGKNQDNLRRHVDMIARLRNVKEGPTARRYSIALIFLPVALAILIPILIISFFNSGIQDDVTYRSRLNGARYVLRVERDKPVPSYPGGSGHVTVFEPLPPLASCSVTNGGRIGKCRAIASDEIDVIAGPLTIVKTSKGNDRSDILWLTLAVIGITILQSSLLTVALWLDDKQLERARRQLGLRA